MSSIALIDRRSVLDAGAAALARIVTHSHILDSDEQGLSVLSGLLSAYPAVETIHIMIYSDADGDFYLGHNRIDRESIADQHLPHCDEMTLIVHGTGEMSAGDLDILCDDLRAVINAVVINALHVPHILNKPQNNCPADFFQGS